MEFRLDSLDFSLPLSGNGPRTASRTVVFPRQVRSAAAGLSGYLAEYSGGNDHHVGRLEIQLSTTIQANTVTVDGTFGVRDWSGDWDDEYDGQIDFVVVAELEPATAPPPRGDLAITGMELNQAIQYFRSNRFLDSANVRPDNSIFLIARKATGIRVYVDWDSTAGLPPITSLSGELVVQNGSTTTTLLPINPGQAITPKRDSNINQALPNDTLNFMIPASQSVGTVTVRCEVFDRANPTARSGAFTRTLVFVPVEPLNIFLVGVTTQNPAAASPSQAQITAALSLLQKTYPRGDVIITGFTNMTLASQIGGPSAPSSGCGDGWSDLLDQLRDLRGGSNDIYFGGLPTGIACASAVIGCSPLGDAVAASFIDLPPTVPHEIGHSMGRRHAPCRGCNSPAQDPDLSYPQYGSFNSDSIGVFGFDPATNTVFNPASTLDFMTAFLGVGCSGNTPTFISTLWISPYTHTALLGAMVGGPTSSAGSPQVRRRFNQMLLFLGLSITRDRQVTRRMSFHHIAPPQGGGNCGDTQFTYEFLNGEKATLDCGPLKCRCEDGCECWPKTIRDALPMPPDAQVLRVWEGDKMLYEEEIPDPPKVHLTATEQTKEGVLIKWESDPAENLTYLVHWKPTKSGAFRGVEPRLTGKSMLIPRRLFVDARELRVRVYATSGIATGFAEAVITLRNHVPSKPTITLGGVTPGDESPRPLDCVASAIVTDLAGAQLGEDKISWYDSRGSLIARGRSVDLRSLPQGRHVVRAVVRGHGGALAARSWLIERTAAGCLYHNAVCDPPIKSRPENHEHPHPAPPPCEG